MTMIRLREGTILRCKQKIMSDDQKQVKPEGAILVYHRCGMYVVGGLEIAGQYNPITVPVRQIHTSGGFISETNRIWNLRDDPYGYKEENIALWWLDPDYYEVVGQLTSSECENYMSNKAIPTVLTKIDGEYRIGFWNYPYGCGGSVVTPPRSDCRIPNKAIVEVVGWPMLAKLNHGTEYRVEIDEKRGAYKFFRPRGRKVLVAHYIYNVDGRVLSLDHPDHNKICIKRCDGPELPKYRMVHNG